MPRLRLRHLRGLRRRPTLRQPASTCSLGAPHRRPPVGRHCHLLFLQTHILRGQRNLLGLRLPASWCRSLQRVLPHNVRRVNALAIDLFWFSCCVVPRTPPLTILALLCSQQCLTRTGSLVDDNHNVRDEHATAMPSSRPKRCRRQYSRRAKFWTEKSGPEAPAPAPAPHRCASGPCHGARVASPPLCSDPHPLD